MRFTATQIANLLQADLEGKPDVVVSNFAKIEEATTGDISFIANPKYQQFAYTTQASVLLVNRDMVFTEPVPATLIITDDAYAALSQLLQLYQNMQQQAKVGIEQPSFIDQSARLGKNVYVGAFAYIGENTTIGNNVKVYPNVYIGSNCIVEDNTTLYAGVKVYHNCQIGSQCTIHAGSVIGADGFGFAPQADGTYQKIPQIGNVIIKNNVEIGANTCIDRGTMGATIIESGVKLDNLIQVAHNVEIDEHTVIAAQTGISGSTKLGKNCLIGGQVGFVGHLKIADGTKINAQSGISKSIKKPNLAWNGSPAFAYNDCLRSQVIFRQLPKLAQTIKAIEKQLKQQQQ